MKLDALPVLAENDRFQILRRIGAGGMGTVYEALDRERNARVAIKALRNINAETLLAFKTEFRDFQHLQHPNLVNVGELFESNGQWFLTMELIEGVTFLEYVRPSSVAHYPKSWVASGGAAGAFADTTPGIVTSTEPPSAPPSPSFNEGRLRAALQQLALGLSTLHAANKVHRDVKPSNVLVSHQGRVVLLDFGLATDVLEREHRSDVVVVGTILYMAPEQAAARQVGAPADWYAMGVVLYEALTGQVPLAGPPMEVLLKKQTLVPTPPRAINPNTPPDLDALCLDLLKFNPSERPTGAQVLQRLGYQTPEVNSPSLSSFSGSSFFVGREREISRLREAYDASLTATRIVGLYGESGVGKSALVRRFISSLADRDSTAVVLIGTCYERESVPFKAVDGLIDSLSQYMRRLPEADAAALLPRRAALLARVFPVLQRVEAFAIAPRRVFGEEVLDPRELRSQVFAALRELLGRLADRRPLVLVIDDLQWADADSFALLSEVLSEPGAPRVLLIATVRTSAEDAKAPALLPDMHAIKIERLSPPEGRELAQALLRNARVPVGMSAEQIAQEAGGHPLYIDELIRHASATGSPNETPIQLDDALWARILQLGPSARRVLELVCLSGSRLIQQTAARAAELGFGEFAKQVAVLRVAHLLRTTGVRSTDAVEPYHSRVRSAVLGHLDGDASVAHHRRLALALETSGQADPEALATHWREAGELDKANHFAVLAAEKAEKALAFDRAVGFYQLALQSMPAAEPPPALRRRLADALANAGRGGEAGDAYLAAVDADPASNLELKRLAAEQLLISGHIDRGLAILREVLAAVGMKMAETPRRALFNVLMSRAKLKLRGLKFEERTVSQIPASELTRVDVCWSAGISLALVDSLRGADFHARSLLLSLRAGEPYRIARALAMGTAAEALPGEKGAKRAARLADEASALAARVGNPHALGLVQLTNGISAFLQGHWRVARESCDAAGTILRERCTGVAWELDNANLYPLWSRIFLGELKGLGARASQLLSSARSRGDLYLETNLRTRVLNMGWLALDRADKARLEVEEGIKHWSQEGFHLQDYFALQSLAEIELYSGEGARAQERLERAWTKLSKSDFFLVQMMRIEMRYLRARCALAAAIAEPATAAKNLSRADELARALEGERAAWAVPLALLVRGMALRLRKDAGSRAQLEAARDKFEHAEMHLHAMCVRRRLGERHVADEWMAAQEIVNPGRMTDLMAPGPDA